MLAFPINPKILGALFESLFSYSRISMKLGICSGRNFCEKMNQG